MAKVDIVIRALNGSSMTKDCVESLAQTVCSHRVILVQSGSDLYKDMADVDIVSRTPMGAVSATNLGLSSSLTFSDSEYVMVMDNDTEVPLGDDGWLDRMIAELEQYPDTAAVGATTDSANPPQHILTVPQTYTGDWGDNEKGGVKDNYQSPVFVSFCVLMKKSAVREVGLWDTRYDPGNFEDTDYALQLRIAGYKVRVARSVYVHHKCHKTFGDNLSKLMNANQRKFVSKWGLGRLWDLGIVPDKEIAIGAGRRAGIVKED